VAVKVKAGNVSADISGTLEAHLKQVVDTVYV